MSALPAGRPCGRLTWIRSVWKKSLPPASRWPVRFSGDAFRAAGRVARRHVRGERVEVAAHLARVARDLGHAALVAVELLERDHRQVDVVLVEAEQRRRVVHQHVGVEHEQRRRAVAARLLRALGAALRGVRGGAGAGARALAATGGAAGSVPSFDSSSSAGATGSLAGRRAGALAGRCAACDSKSARLRKSARLAGGLGRGIGELGGKGRPLGWANGVCERRPIAASAERADGAGGRAAQPALLDGLDGLQHFFDVAGDRQAAPLGAQHAGAVDQEGAALDALHLLAVHDLVLDDAEHVAELLFGVGDQLERQLEVLLEAVVRRHVVARDAEQHGAGLDEFLVVIAELHRLGGATGRIVLRVEVQDDDLAGVGLRRELHPSCCERFKFRDRFIDCRRHEVLVG